MGRGGHTCTPNADFYLCLLVSRANLHRALEPSRIVRRDSSDHTDWTLIVEAMMVQTKIATCCTILCLLFLVATPLLLVTACTLTGTVTVGDNLNPTIPASKLPSFDSNGDYVIFSVSAE